jgi:DNA repair protein RadC
MTDSSTMTVMIVCERHYPSIKISTPKDSYHALAKYHAKKQEHFLVLTLDTANYAIAVRLVSIGTVNRTVAHPREIFRYALEDNASAIVVAHNHPSGHLTPSPEDIELTKRLVQAGEIMGISVLDHIVFCKTSYYSFRENELMEFIEQN